MQEDKKILFIPAYNCQEQIKRLLERLKLSEIEEYKEILIIDNNSSDKTALVARETVVKKKFKNFKIIKNNNNYGLGGSHKIAFNYSIDNNYDYCCVMHGDDQGNIKDLNKVVYEKAYRNFSCLRAGRFKPGSKLIGYSTFRIIGNHIFKLFFSIMMSKKIYDIGAGIAIYNVQDLKKINYENFVDDMSFDSFMLLVLDYYNLKYDFFNVEWKEEDQISNTKLLNTAFKILKNIILYKLNKKNFIEKFYVQTKKKYLYEKILWI